ncbi:hypothetical protein GGE65_004576 [Skermanella aerolata]|uniref:hypothetical protein n=1 Tax=Skermanella aerolata TaxID=393310 RepID=UPI0011BEFEB8|nr:hypothetical protein [Skermanella aerolata]
MGTAVRTAKSSPASWAAFADVDAFVDEVLMELAAMEADGTKPTRSGPKPALTGAAPCQVDHGDLVSVLLWHAVTRDRPAVRYPVQHALHAVRPLDPARPVALPARSAALHLAAGLR